MDLSCKLDSGSVTPKAESFSILETESSKILNENDEAKQQPEAVRHFTKPLIVLKWQIFFGKYLLLL